MAGMYGAIRRAVGLAAALMCMLPASAWASPDFNTPSPFDVNGLQIRSTVGAGIQTNEPLTDAGPGSCAGNKITSTIWWSFIGTGGPVIVTTEGSNFDTHISLYPGPPPASVFGLPCSNDRFTDDADAEVGLNTVAGQQYLLQVGGCDNNPPGGCPHSAEGSSGTAWFAALTNNDRSFPETLQPGSGTKTNAGATTDGTEPTSCGAADYDKTVWFRYVASAEGDVTYSTSGFDTVTNAYRGTTRLDCNDDAGDVNSSEVRFHVDRGETYLIQVGGLSDADGVFFGGFTYRLGFVEDLDHDNDGYNRSPGPDCNDDNAGIHPNAPSVTGNGVDEDCDGSDPPSPTPPVDLDRDGSPAGQDCDDANKGRRPGNTEIRGNGRDEDCIGGDLAFQRLATSYGISGVWGAFGRFTRLELRNVEAGSTVRIRCRGKGCRRKTIVRRVRKAARRLQFAKAMRRNRPRPGARIEVRVTKPGKIGKLFTYRIRSFKEPVERTLCLPPGASRASRCRR